MPASRPFATLIPLAVGLVLSALGAALVLARLGSPPVDRHVQDEGGPLASPDARIGYVPTPSTVTRRRHVDSGVTYTVRTDDRGARVSDDAPPSAHPQAALVVIGGSYAWGQGIAARDTFAERLGRALDWPIANLGFAGYGTVQSLLRLERSAGSLRPRVVVYGFIEDHLRRNLSPCAPTYGAGDCIPWAHVEFDARGAPRIVPPDANTFRRLLERGRPGSLPSWASRVRLGAHRLLDRTHPSEAPDDPVLRSRAMAHLLERMARSASAAGARLVIAHLPWFGGAPDPPPVELLEALPQGVVFVDLSAAVERHRRAPDAVPLVIEGDGHPNAAAHALIARELEGWIRRKGLADGRP